jgi:hypothetical protein
MNYPRFTDGGGRAPGKARRRKDGNSEFYHCGACNKDQIESILARSRVSRVRCRHCGLVIYPKTEKEEESLKRTCLFCTTTLRSTNENPVCVLCFSRVSEEGKLKAASFGGKYVHAAFGESTAITWCGKQIKELLWEREKVDCWICIKRSSLATPFPGRPLPHPSIIGAPIKPPVRLSADPPPQELDEPDGSFEEADEGRTAEAEERSSAAYQEWLERNPQPQAVVDVSGLCPKRPDTPRVKILSDVRVQCSGCIHFLWVEAPLGVVRKKYLCPCCLGK